MFLNNKTSVLTLKMYRKEREKFDLQQLLWKNEKRKSIAKRRYGLFGFFFPPVEYL